MDQPTPVFGNSPWTNEEKQAIQKLLENKMGLDKVAFRPGPAKSMFLLLEILAQVFPETLVYTATSQVIEEVNNIFGPDGWSSSVTNLSQDFVCLLKVQTITALTSLA